jgi:hypothetical protein
MRPRAGRRSGRRIAVLHSGVLTLNPFSTVLAADQTVEPRDVLPLDLYPWIAYPPAGDFHPAPSFRRTV